MKLTKAIKLLTVLISPPFTTYGDDDYDAIKLGIEALKARLYMKENFPEQALPLLPGETEK